MYLQQSQQKPGMTHGDALNLIYRILCVVATCVTPLLRNGFGVESPGMNGLLATLLLIVVCPSVPDMSGYFLLWVFALVMQRISTLRNAYRGVVVHSRYDGFPYWATKLPLMKTESRARLIGEPLLCLAFGGLFRLLGSPQFGCLLMGCGVALFLKCLVERGIRYTRVQRMRDAEIEQRWYAAQFRREGK